MKIIRAVLSFLFVSMIALSVSIQPAFAFHPDEQGHLGITSAAAKSVTRVVGSVTLRFSDQAVKEIRDANRSTDFPPTFFDPEKHFDNEEFFRATTRLLEFKKYIIGQIADPFFPNGANARIALGGALHTIQDFYSHTNWVELGNTVIDDRLGRSVFDSPSPKAASVSSDGGTLLPGLTQLTSGYFSLPLVCSVPAGKVHHTGLPILCPNGLNKDAPGKREYVMAHSLAVTASQDYIEQILNDPSVAGNARAIRVLMGI